MTRRPCPNTAELFKWQPPEPVKAFQPERVKAATLGNQMARVISESLQDCEAGREDIAAKMSAFLGQPVSLNMLDKYASEAAEDHIINIVRFIALLHATGDRRPLQHIAELFGWMVIPQSYRKVIELARKEEKIRLEKKEARRLRQEAKSEGTI